MAKKKIKNKNPKRGSTIEQVRVFAKDDGEISMPRNVRLPEKHRTFFEDIVAEYDFEDWSAHQLTMAIALAKYTYLQEKYLNRLDREGPLLKSDRGTPIPHPIKTMLQQCTGSILNLRRSLSLHARAQMGDARDIYAKRKKREEDTQKTKDIYATDENEELIPKH
jgi:hypothetical protein